MLRFIILLVLVVNLQSEEIDFGKDIKPIFEAHCIKCHGADKQKSGYRLDVKKLALGEADLGSPNIVPGHPEKSPLVKMIARNHSDEIYMPPKSRDALSKEQISRVTNWIKQGAPWPDSHSTEYNEKNRLEHWSFKPLKKVNVPEIKSSWGNNEIDKFIFRKLKENGLSPAAKLDEETLIRRTSISLHGLIPSAKDLEIVRVRGFRSYIDHLLESPRYGERWAQHWLDITGYGDTHGFEVNTNRPNAWPYRDYVIKSFNDDIPYIQFVYEQVAGDTVNKDTATGFLVTSPVLLPGQIGKDKEAMLMARQDQLDSIVTNVGDTFLGLTVGCARCHNHKFDPVSQRDYYSLLAVFSGVRFGERILPVNKDVAELKGKTSKGMKFYGGVFGKPEKIRRLARGNVNTPKEEMIPDTIKFLGRLNLKSDSTDKERRQSLAKSLISNKNPLTARVMVNRIWQYHFGTGIVNTPNDFGHMGGKPSHPELLDWLAGEFIRNNWSVKYIQRLIVNSATFQQQAVVTTEAGEKDISNRLLSHFSSRRAEAEVIHDSILKVSGKLNLKMGGQGYELFTGSNFQPQPIEKLKEEAFRRRIYAKKVRMEKDAVFADFDIPDGGQACPKRNVSTTPVQAMNLFNSQFIADQALYLAEKLKSENKGVESAFFYCLGRKPDLSEKQSAVQLVQKHGLAQLCRVLFNSSEFTFIP